MDTGDCVWGVVTSLLAFMQNVNFVCLMVIYGMTGRRQNKPFNVTSYITAEIYACSEANMSHYSNK
ncbi:MAG: hypothetical protein MJ212_02710 [Alphaproteobacteria bacterium]|nr:hypothetical protein [Alphaproteobacteria bacterium]